MLHITKLKITLKEKTEFSGWPFPNILVYNQRERNSSIV